MQIGGIGIDTRVREAMQSVNAKGIVRTLIAAAAPEEVALEEEEQTL